MPMVIGLPDGPASTGLLLSLLRPHAATAALAAIIAASRKDLTCGRLIVSVSFGASATRATRWCAEPWRAPRTTSRQPWPQAGLGLTIATEPCAVVGSTWTNLAPLCHWKMKCEATMFWPMALNFAGPCTVCTVTPLCSHEMTFAFDRLLVALTAAARVSPTEYASAESALMSAGVPPYLAL